MAPRRNTTGSGANKGYSQSRSMTALRESTPRPYIQTPSSDIPSVRSNRPVELTLSSAHPNTAGADLTHGDLSSKIIDLGYAEGSKFAIKYIHVWAPPSVSGTLRLADSVSGVATEDSGSFLNGPRVGLNYPRVLQIPIAVKASSATVVAHHSFNPATESSSELRIGVTVWPVA